MMNCLRRLSPLVVLFLFCAGRSAIAAGLDRDGILTEAPAAPEAGTVRVSGIGGAQSQHAPDSTNAGSITGETLLDPTKDELPEGAHSGARGGASPGSWMDLPDWPRPE
jgi:hypothetical protein